MLSHINKLILQNGGTRSLQYLSEVILFFVGVVRAKQLARPVVWCSSNMPRVSDDPAQPPRAAPATAAGSTPMGPPACRFW